MSLWLDAGEVAFRNSSGTVRWSSNDKNLLITNTINSSFVINAKNPSGGSIISTETTNLGAVASNASVILGTYIDGSKTYTIGGDRVFYSSQARMINADAYQTWPTGVLMFASMVWYRLDITGGNLVATVNYSLPQLAAASPGTTIQVRALIGGFEF